MITELKKRETDWERHVIIKLVTWRNHKEIILCRTITGVPEKLKSLAIFSGKKFKIFEFKSHVVSEMHRGPGKSG